MEINSGPENLKSPQMLSLITDMGPVADTAVNDLLNQYWRELSSDLFNEMSDELLEISKVVINLILGVFPVEAIISP